MAHQFRFSARILLPKLLPNALLPTPTSYLSISQLSFPIRYYALPFQFQARLTSSFRRRLERSRQQRENVPRGELQNMEEDEDEGYIMTPETLEHIIDNYHFADWVEDDWLNDAVNNRSIQEMMQMGYLEYGKRMVDIPGRRGRMKRRVNEVRAVWEAMNSWSFSDDEEEEKVSWKQKKKEAKNRQKEEEAEEARRDREWMTPEQIEMKMRERAEREQEERERKEQEKIEQKKRRKEKLEKEKKQEAQRQLEKQKKREEYANYKLEKAKKKKLEKEKKAKKSKKR